MYPLVHIYTVEQDQEGVLCVQVGGVMYLCGSVAGVVVAMCSDARDCRLFS